MESTKRELITLLESIATYMELQGENPFKVSAFRKAAGTLESEERSLDEMENFTALPGIGKGTATVIEEFKETGSSSLLIELQEKVPKSLVMLLQIPGLGGKKIAKLHKELGIVNVDELKAACTQGKVRSLAGFGVKSEENILASIESINNRPDTLPIAYVLPIAEEIEKRLSQMEQVQAYSRAGSLRRVKERVKDLDFIIATESPKSVRNMLLEFPNVKEIIGAGDTKVSIVLQHAYDVSVDFRMVKPNEFATTLHHFTGSKEHNVKMRQLAKERGEKISEYGVENLETGNIRTFQTEQEFYRYFELPHIPPEMRETGVEIEDYTNELGIITLNDIKGDLHMHSTWSDGQNTIEEMVQACRERGYSYMAITDHSKYLKVANGLNEERLKKQREEINRLNQKYEDITILAGVEMDILPDGSLDFEDDFLQEMDLVIASIHSGFSQPQEQIMNRLTTALKNAHVDIIAHPTGRKIGMREGYDVDMHGLIKLAKDTNTALELNANPNRLDLNSEMVSLAQDAGVTIVINTDAHRTETLSHMSIGVSTAIKGWIRRENVLNGMNVDELVSYLKKK